MIRFILPLLVIFSIGTAPLLSQNIIDSLLLERQIKMKDYENFIDNMQERSWINLVNSHEKSAAIIELDDQIINNYLEKERRKRKELTEKIESQNLDIALLKKETQVQQMILDEKRFMNRTLLIVIGSISLLFFVLLILYIDRQSRFRAARMELEHLWKTHEDIDASALQKDEINIIREQLFKTTDEVEKLKKENQQLLNEKAKVEKNLKKEITVRNEAEQEIKSLIEQIKKI